MKKVKVDHNGQSTGSDGLVYSYEADVEVELPEDVIKALGDSAYEGDKKAEDAKPPVEKPKIAEPAKVNPVESVTPKEEKVEEPKKEEIPGK